MNLSIYIAATTGKAVKIDARRKAVFPGGVVAWALGEGHVEFEGRGIVTDASFLYAAAAVECLDYFLQEQRDEDELSIRFICKAAGIQGIVAGLLRQWAATGGKNAVGHHVENYPAWKRLGELCELGRVLFMHPSPEHAMIHDITHNHAKSLRDTMPPITANSTIGLQVNVRRV